MTFDPHQLQFQQGDNNSDGTIIAAMLSIHLYIYIYFQRFQ